MNHLERLSYFFELRLVDTSVQLVCQVPEKLALLEPGIFFTTAIYGVIDPFDEGVGKREVHVGADSMTPGKFHPEPVLHAGTLDHDRFRFDGGSRGLFDHAAERGAELFEPVAPVKMDHTLRLD